MKQLVIIALLLLGFFTTKGQVKTYPVKIEYDGTLSLPAELVTGVPQKYVDSIAARKADQIFLNNLIANLPNQYSPKVHKHSYTDIIGLATPTTGGFAIPVEIKTIEGIGSYWIRLDQTYKNPDGKTDNVLHLGYNINGTGGLVNTKEPSIHDAWESNYTKFAGSEPVLERHIEVNAIDPITGAIIKTRVLSFQPSRKSKFSDMQMRSTTYSFQDMFDRVLFDFNENGNYTLYGKGNTAKIKLVNRTDNTEYTVQAVGGAITHITNGKPNLFDGQVRTPSLQMGNNVWVLGPVVNGKPTVIINGVTFELTATKVATQ